MRAIVTLRFKKNLQHNRFEKVWGSCPLSKVCTDSTGEHHSYISEDYATLGQIRKNATELADRLGAIVTRVELIGNVDKKDILAKEGI